jgi:hypothetical protein
MSMGRGGRGCWFVQVTLALASFAGCVGDDSVLIVGRAGGGGAGGMLNGSGGATPGAGGAAGAWMPPSPMAGAGGSTGTASCASSYTDALPGVPAALIPPSSLAPGDGVAHAGCRAALDNGSTSTSASSTEIVGGPGHAGGHFYYEATVREFESGWSSVGVSAPPDRVGAGPLAGSFQEAPTSAASVFADGTGVIGVALDIDAGTAFFFSDGKLIDQRQVSLLPGVGAYGPAIVSMVGNAIEVNFGQAPFAFAIPEGYAAWASGLVVDRNGACVADVVPPAPPAPITGVCDSPKVSTFLSACGSDLVALGIYTTDQSNSNHGEGTTLVHVNRPGHITLGLSAYEPTHWVVDTVDGSYVDRIFVYGFYTPRVDAPAGTVVVVSGEQMTGGMQWPFDDEGDDTPGYVAALERDAGTPLSMFGGCYAATEFTVGD